MINMYKSPYFKYQDHHELMSLFNAIFSISHDGIYVCDNKGKALLFNDSLLEVSKIPVNALSHYSVFELVEKNIIPTSAAAISLKTKKKENMIIDYYNGKKTILTATPVFDKQNEIICVVSNVRDITELNRLQKELEESYQINSKFQKTLNKIQEEFQASSDLIYRSKSMTNVVSLASRISKNDSPVMILGESGVGKDVLAQFIHNQSNRSGSFVRINCGAIPDHLLESELFGYEKGAFTGATGSKAGLFELADKGTIFLDEIGDLPFPLQVKLLNVLQDKQIRRIGGTKTQSIDMRIISATNSDLHSLIEQKKFRSDLFYRLNVLSITIPPLREREDDITAFTFYFLKQLEDKYGLKKRMDTQAMDALLSYGWPGNIRELKNMVERIYHMSDTDTITLNLLPQTFRKSTKFFLKSDDIIGDNIQLSLKEATHLFEKNFIQQAIESTSTLKECSEKLNIDISTIVRKKKKLGIM